MIFAGTVLNETLTMYLSLTLCGFGSLGLVGFGGADSENALRITSVVMGLGIAPIYTCILLYMEKLTGSAHSQTRGNGL